MLSRFCDKKNSVYWGSGFEGVVHQGGESWRPGCVHSVGTPQRECLLSHSSLPHTAVLKLSPCSGVCVCACPESHRQAQGLRSVTGSVFAERT